MALQELEKSIEKANRIMKMQSDMLDAMMKALICIAHEKPLTPELVAVGAINNYRQILAQTKADNSEAAQ